MGALNPDFEAEPRATFLTIPAELRNQIYTQLFPQPLYISPKVDEAIELPTLADFGKSITYGSPYQPISHAAITGACRQLFEETRLLYLENTIFHLPGPMADPLAFAHKTSHMRPRTKSAIRHIVLSGRISHLRALNETWDSLPFGDEDLFLETLTLVPHRPETAYIQPYTQPYTEVADLSQCHTLAYILTETLKGLRNVGTVIVRNEGCFNAVIWRLAYRGLVYRLWKWGGRLSDLRFKEDEEEQTISVRCGRDMATSRRAADDKAWRDACEEMKRLLGGEGNEMDEQTV